jgi:hypothetical protein
MLAPTSFPKTREGGFFYVRTIRNLMKNPNNLEVSSYAGGILSIGAGLTLENWAVIVGIATALLTLLLNVWYTRQKNRREERETAARLHALAALEESV